MPQFIQYAGFISYNASQTCVILSQVLSGFFLQFYLRNYKPRWFKWNYLITGVFMPPVSRHSSSYYLRFLVPVDLLFLLPHGGVTTSIATTTFALWPSRCNLLVQCFQSAVFKARISFWELDNGVWLPCQPNKRGKKGKTTENKGTNLQNNWHEELQIYKARTQQKRETGWENKTCSKLGIRDENDIRHNYPLPLNLIQSVTAHEPLSVFD